MEDELKLYEITYIVPYKRYEHLEDKYEENALEFSIYATGISIEDVINSNYVKEELKKGEERTRLRYSLHGDELKAQIYSMKDVNVPGYEIKLEKITSEFKNKNEENKSEEIKTRHEQEKTWYDDMGMYFCDL